MQHCVWKTEALHRGVPTLLEHIGFVTDDVTLPPLRGNLSSSDDAFSLWITHASAQTGIDMQAVSMQYESIEAELMQTGPALLALPGEKGGFLLLLGGNKRTLRLWGMDESVHKLPTQEVRALLTAHLEEPLLPSLNRTLDRLAITGERHDRVLREMLHQQLATSPVCHAYLMRLPPGSSFWQQIRLARLPTKFSWFMASMLAAQLSMLMAWVIIGESIFHITGFHGMLELWALLLLTTVPLQAISLRVKNQLSLDFGYLLRKRLLDGILQLRSDEIRDQGSGSFLNQVMNIEFLEGQCLSMVFVTLMAFLQLMLAMVVLSMGIGGMAHASILLAFLALFCWFARRYYRHMKAWILHARTLSLDLTENMLGHRTRLAQQHPDMLHLHDDEQLAHYARLSRLFDQSEAIMRSLFGRRGWMVVAILGLAPAFGAARPDIQLLTISIGGILLAAISLDQLTQSLRHAMGAWIVWEQLRHIYYSSRRRLEARAPSRFIPPEETRQRQKQYPLLAMRDVEFSYHDRPILNGCNLRLDAGQRLLLEGASGCGKSTLAALIAGLERPHEGTIRLMGLPRERWGNERWRREIVISPQFQENHVLNASFAFNLLMGRNWPPSPSDLMEAEAICRELQLGELLDRMPAGMQQMVGESGWRLSHGERSRLYIARSLLQAPRLLILDESFAALDPATLNIALRCVLQRSDALLLIAHP